MFGHQNNNDQAITDHAAPTADVTPGAPETISPTNPPSAPPADDHSNDYVMTDLPHVQNPDKAAAQSPAPSTPAVVNAPAGAHDAADSHDNGDARAALVPAAHAGDLLELKQSALQELSPLIGHLEQTPEEKFRTTMMMIQASDDQSLLQTAFEAAKQIGDEKARAQALLDVVNEINYFTQQQSS